MLRKSALRGRERDDLTRGGSFSSSLSRIESVGNMADSDSSTPNLNRDLPRVDPSEQVENNRSRSHTPSPPLPTPTSPSLSKLTPTRGRRRHSNRSRARSRARSSSQGSFSDDPNDDRPDDEHRYSYERKSSFHEIPEWLFGLGPDKVDKVVDVVDDAMDRLDEIVEDAIRMIPHDNLITSLIYQVSYLAFFFVAPYAVMTKNTVHQFSPAYALPVSLCVSVMSFYKLRDYRRVWLHNPEVADIYEARSNFMARTNTMASEETASGPSTDTVGADAAYIPYSYKRIKRGLQQNAIEAASDKFREKHSYSKVGENSFKSEKVEHLKIIPYAHGGYFGCSPYMLGDSTWVGLLSRLQPDVFCEVSRRLGANVESLIHWGENSPLVASFGVTSVLNNRWQNQNRDWWKQAHDSDLPAIEWDLFLDPSLVDKMLEDDGTDLGMNMKIADPLAESLFLRGLIAHGSGPQLILEQLGGLFRHFNFGRVNRSRKTLGGGITVQEWLTLFAKGLQVGIEEEENNEGKMESIGDVLYIISKVLNGKLKVVLDLKSRYVPKKIWARLVKASSKYVEVVGIGSFCIDEIRGISGLVAPFLSWQLYEFFFFHTAGDLQAAVHNGVLRRGDAVFFNAGSLLWNKPNSWKSAVRDLKSRWAGEYLDPKVKEYAACNRVEEGGVGLGVSTIQSYRDALDLQIGLYVQEHSIDSCSLDCIVTHVNENLHVYKLGLAWGGLEGHNMSGIRPTFFTSTDGLWKQRYVGKSWDRGKSPKGLKRQTVVLPSATPVKFIKQRGTYQAGQDRDTLASYGRQLGAQRAAGGGGGIAKMSNSLEKNPTKGSAEDLLALFGKELGEQRRADEAGEEQAGEAGDGRPCGGAPKARSASDGFG